MNRYDEIFESYVGQLAVARDQALAWWERLEEQAVAEGGEPAETEGFLRPVCPAGPVSHPRVLEVYRKHAVDVVEFNEAEYARLQAQGAEADPADGSLWGAKDEATDGELSAPDVLLEWLEEKQPELSSFLEELVVLPVEAPLPDLQENKAAPLSRPRPFTFETIHDLQRGKRRLMTAPTYLPRSAPPNASASFASASPEHQQLFIAYEQHLELALVEAERWWGGIIKNTTGGLFRRKSKVVANAYQRFFAGPATRPELQWTLHTYWTRCAALNERCSAASQIHPEVLLLEWLDDGRHPGWVEAITCLPYWPIGMDENGHWV